MEVFRPLEDKYVPAVRGCLSILISNQTANLILESRWRWSQCMLPWNLEVLSSARFCFLFFVGSWGLIAWSLLLFFNRFVAWCSSGLVDWIVWLVLLFRIPFAVRRASLFGALCCILSPFAGLFLWSSGLEIRLLRQLCSFISPLFFFRVQQVLLCGPLCCFIPYFGF